tara:strand:- start:515 stop:1558 length:1044 start_codon:yes stop_codon:yes gene_type:complete
MSWKKNILSSQSDIKKVIKVINESEFKIILITDKNKKLIGTVTDGDIRRCFLNHSASLNDPIKMIMKNSPVTALSSEDDSSLLMKMKKYKISYIPIINKNKNLIGLKSFEALIDDNKVENPVLIMAGGFGKRMMPLTKDTPKPLLKINDLPILEIIIRNFLRDGFRKFYISTYYKSRQIKKYFGNGKKWGANIFYIEEKLPLGTAGCLQLIPRKDLKLPVIVSNGDILTNIDYKKLLKSHIKRNAHATICVREQIIKSDFGVVNIKNGLLTKIEEKPESRNLINAGVYIINGDSIPKIKKNTYIDMPEILNKLASKKKKVNIFFVFEKWQDIGHIHEYNKAIESFKN